MSDDEIRIDTSQWDNEVRGYVGRHEVMSMNSRVDGQWMVGSSSCLPTDPRRAKLYLDCMCRVFAKAGELGARTTQETP